MLGGRLIVKINSKSPQTCTKKSMIDRQVDELEDQNCENSSSSLVNSLKACARAKDLPQGIRMHANICRDGYLKKNVYVGSALVNMYAKCGKLGRAKQVLEELPSKNVVSWNALIAGFTNQGQGQEALGCFWRMCNEGFSPDAITYTCILKACGVLQDADMGMKIHEQIVSRGWKKHMVLGSALVDMYGKCGVLIKAKEVFDELSIRNVVTWTALIGGYAEHGQGQEALACFQQMCSEGFSPNAMTYACVLKACSLLQDLNLGKRIHDEVANQGLLKDVQLGNALIDMYAKCGSILKAQKVLNELPVRNVVSWTTFIAYYAQQGDGEKALGCFEGMLSDGLSPNAVTYVCILNACALLRNVNMGRKIHEEIKKQGMLKDHAKLGTSLVDMYAKCGLLTQAQEVFDDLPLQDETTWTALIKGYFHQGLGKEALSCFQQMRMKGLCPDVVSWNALIGGYTQQGLAKEALDCFQLMQHDGIAPDAFTLFHVAQCKESLSSSGWESNVSR